MVSSTWNVSGDALGNLVSLAVERDDSQQKKDSPDIAEAT
jgi:hypothetical protein